MAKTTLILNLLALVNRLVTRFIDVVQRRRIWMEYHNAQIASQMEKLRRAIRVRRNIRDRHSNNDDRLQNDGYRRD